MFSPEHPRQRCLPPHKQLLHHHPTTISNLAPSISPRKQWSKRNKELQARPCSPWRRWQGGGMGSRFVHPAMGIPVTAGVAGSLGTSLHPVWGVGCAPSIALGSKTPGECQQHCPSPCKSLCHGNSPTGVEK